MEEEQCKIQIVTSEFFSMLWAPDLGAHHSNHCVTCLYISVFINLILDFIRELNVTPFHHYSRLRP